MSLVLLVHAAVTATAAEPTAAAQAELTTLLATADSIDAVTPAATGVAFAIDRGGEAYRITADTRAGAVVAVTVLDLGRAPAHPRGGLTWLAHELPTGAAIATIVVDARGTVTAATTTGTRYALLAGHDGNSAVAARWAAAWDAPGDG